MFSLPWYAAIFIAIPETFLIIHIGFSLFNVNIRLKSSVIAAVIVGIISLAFRDLQIYPGLRIIIVILLLGLMITLLEKIKLWYSCICAMLGSMIDGVIENTVMPLVLTLISKTFNDMASDPWLNIEVYMATFFTVVIVLLFIKKLKLVLYDLGERGSSCEER